MNTNLTESEILKAFTTLYLARQPEDYKEGDKILKEVVGNVPDYQRLRNKLFDYVSGRWNANHRLISDWQEVEPLLYINKHP